MLLFLWGTLTRSPTPPRVDFAVCLLSIALLSGKALLTQKERRSANPMDISQLRCALATVYRDLYSSYVLRFFLGLYALAATKRTKRRERRQVAVATCRAPHEAAAAVKQPRGRCEPAASLAAARPHAAAASPLSAAYLQVLVALASAGPQTRHRSSQLDARQQCRPRLAEMYHAARSIVKDATVKVAAVKDAAVKVAVVKDAAMSTAATAERALRNWAAISAAAPAARATRSHLCEDARGASRTGTTKLADGDHQTCKTIISISPRSPECAADPSPAVSPRGFARAGAPLVEAPREMTFRAPLQEIALHSILLFHSV